MSDDRIMTETRSQIARATGFSILAAIPILVSAATDVPGITSILLLTPAVIGLTCFAGYFRRMAGIVFCYAITVFLILAMMQSS